MIAGQYLGHLAECRDCHEPIRFVTMPPTAPGNPPRRMPVNPKPGKTGNIAARLTGRELQGYVVTDKHPADARHPLRFVSHFASCEDRKPKPKPSPEPEETPLW